MPDLFNGRHVLLGVTGGIAAYKACDLASRLVKAGAVVDVVMTPKATEFVGPPSFQALTGRTVHYDGREAGDCRPEHVALAERGDLAIVAPATYNTIGKLAGGLADNLLTATLAAFQGKLLLAPALNSAMWEKEAFLRNLRFLVEQGARVVGPASGRLACGTVGVGRMEEPAAILDAAAVWLAEEASCRSRT